MICPNCGNQIRTGARFCGRCGQPLSAAPPQMPSPVAQQGGAKLVIQSGPGVGQQYPLTQPVVTLGRSSQNTIPLQDNGASRQHAEIREQGGNYFITDSGSSNGTIVNGRRVGGWQVLQPGDQIVIGNTTLVFYSAGGTPGMYAAPGGTRRATRPSPRSPAASLPGGTALRNNLSIVIGAVVTLAILGVAVWAGLSFIDGESTPTAVAHATIAPATKTSSRLSIPTSTAVSVSTATSAPAQPTNTASTVPLGTPVPVLPTGGMLFAGEPYGKDGISIVLSSQYGVRDRTILLGFYVHNGTDKAKVVRFQNGYFHLTDDLGNEYAQDFRDLYPVTKQHQIDADRTLEISSSQYDYGADDTDRIGSFGGIVDIDASYLVVTVEQFMGMENLKWQLPLLPLVEPDEQNPAPGQVLEISQPFLKNGIAAALSSDYGVRDSTIWLNFNVGNQGELPALLRFQNGAFHLHDDLGNEYPQLFPDLYYTTKQYKIDAGRILELSSSQYDYGADDMDQLGAFEGVIDIDASYLLVTVDRLAGMRDLNWRIDLTPATASSEQNPPPGQLLNEGQPFVKNGVGIALSSEYQIRDDKIWLNFNVGNQGGNPAIVRFQNGHFRLYDDLGNEYAQRFPDLYHVTKQNKVNAGKSLELSSSQYDYGADDADQIGVFEGVIDVNAAYLIVTVERFMGMENLQWQLDL